MLDTAKTVLDWFVPPMSHDETTQYLWRVRIAFFGCLSFAAIVFFAVALLFEWGPAIIRPASAQVVQTQVASVKRDVGDSLKAVQGHLDIIERQQHDDRVERLEQQLLWYRQQNCKTKGALGKGLYMQKIGELKERYTDITGKDWQMPTCADLGE